MAAKNAKNNDELNNYREFFRRLVKTCCDAAVLQEQQNRTGLTQKEVTADPELVPLDEPSRNSPNM